MSYVASVNRAHEAHGSGSKLRISLDFETLKNAARMIEERPKSSSATLLQFSYRNLEGKSLKSAEEVKQQLDAEGRLEELVSNATKNQTRYKSFGLDCRMIYCPLIKPTTLIMSPQWKTNPERNQAR